MGIFKKPDINNERDFEKKLILSKKDRYIATDVIEKYVNDAGWRAKIQLIENALGDVRNRILDVGANTCGEAEYLCQKAYSIIATDINEYSLNISQERVAKFNRMGPKYLVADAHQLPIANGSVNFVIFSEVFHHMYDPNQVMCEVNRVLVPGGRIFFYEPYTYNPVRRFSELRDRFKGTIEKSFSLRKLKRIAASAGLLPIEISRHVLPPSEWKMEHMNIFRKCQKKLYYWIAKSAPTIFGNIAMLVEKPSIPRT